jgi:hypothetical protein
MGYERHVARMVALINIYKSLVAKGSDVIVLKTQEIVDIE